MLIKSSTYIHTFGMIIVKYVLFMLIQVWDLYMFIWTRQFF